jgi:hypothetical protein
MISILSHKGNANQNYTKIPCPPSQIGNHQKIIIIMARMQEERNPHSVLVGM